MKKDMRVLLTRRLLKEGLIRCMEEKSVSKITVSDLCRESGINRTTFYNHYDSPAMILRDIAWDYAGQLKSVYQTAKKEKKSGEKAVEACLTFLYERKSEIKIMLSENAENLVSGFGLEIVNHRLAEENDDLKDIYRSEKDDIYLYNVITSSAVYGLIRIWLIEDIDKTPMEIISLMKKFFGDSIFS